VSDKELEKELEGVDSELIRGNIDTIILKALMKGDKYGYEIIKDIEHKSGGAYNLKQPTLYACLKRLEEQGFARSYWGAKSLGGRKKYYSLTDMGRAVFDKSKNEWEHSKSVVDMLISDNEMAGFEVAKKEVIEIDNSPFVDKDSDTFFYALGKTDENEGIGSQKSPPLQGGEVSEGHLFYGVNQTSGQADASQENISQENASQEQDIPFYETLEEGNNDSMFSQLIENNTPSFGQTGLDKLFEHENDALYTTQATENAPVLNSDDQNIDDILDVYSQNNSYAKDMENIDYSPSGVQSSQSFNPFNETDFEEELPFDRVTINKQTEDAAAHSNLANTPPAQTQQGQNVSIYYHNSSTNIYNSSSDTSSTTTTTTTHNAQENDYNDAVEIAHSPYDYEVAAATNDTDTTPAPNNNVIELLTPPPQSTSFGNQYNNHQYSYSAPPNISMSEADIIRRDYRNALEKLVRNNIKHKTVTAVVQTMADAKLEKLKEEQDNLGEQLIIRRHDDSLKDYNAENYFYKNRMRLFHHGMMFVIMMVQIAIMLLVHRLLAPFGAEFRALDIWFYAVSVVVSFAVFPLIAVIFAARDYSARKQIKFDFMGSLLFRLIVVACLWGIIFIVNMLMGIFRYDFTQFLATLVLPSILVLNVFISLFLHKAFLNSGRFNVKN